MIDPLGPYRCVTDASALLAYAQQEQGGVLVRGYLPSAAVSATNWSEAVQKSLARGLHLAEVQGIFAEFGLSIVPSDAAQAEAAAQRWEQTHALGLSLADRACLALAQLLQVPVLTADRAWAGLPLPVEVQVIR